MDSIPIHPFDETKSDNLESTNKTEELKDEIDLLNGDITLLIDELHRCCATLRRQDLVICSQLELIRRLSKFGRRDPPANLMERSASLDNIMKKYVDKNLSTMLR